MFVRSPISGWCRPSTGTLTVLRSSLFLWDSERRSRISKGCTCTERERESTRLAHKHTPDVLDPDTQSRIWTHECNCALFVLLFDALKEPLCSHCFINNCSTVGLIVAEESFSQIIKLVFWRLHWLQMADNKQTVFNRCRWGSRNHEWTDKPLIKATANNNQAHLIHPRNISEVNMRSDATRRQPVTSRSLKT